MLPDAWLPIGFVLGGDLKTQRTTEGGANWQIVETSTAGRALLVRPELATRWASSGLISMDDWNAVGFGPQTIYALSSPSSKWLCNIATSRSPSSKSEAMAFAVSLKETRLHDAESSLHDAIYVEALSRLLPTFSLTEPVADDVILGRWLTGGITVSACAHRRLESILTWLGKVNLSQVLDASGVSWRASSENAHLPSSSGGQEFTLSGRPALEQFFREHVIDLIQNDARYRALGIDFPSAIILHGPPGCGKTFAVERLIEYLGWPSFSIDATSIGSPFIHETSRKVAEVFDKAIKEAPSVLVIDEMEAFLADRESGSTSSHHRVEEVGEFLRRIPDAIKNHVLIIAMTNRLEMIDPAIQRRGRFDHVVLVGMPSQQEVRGLLDTLLNKLPTDSLDLDSLATELAGRPLSDVAFVVRESARLAARSGLTAIDQASVDNALKSTPPRAQANVANKIGFI